MRVLVHDYCGHPFQAELSRELSRRGHEVTHSYSPAYRSGKGALTAGPGETVVFEGVGPEDPIDRRRFLKRLLAEVATGVALGRQARRARPDVALVANLPVPGLVVFALIMWLLRRPWVLWHQDVYAVALRSFAGDKLSHGFRAVAAAFEMAERWCSRRAAAIVVIAPSFLTVHEKWGTAGKVTVIPNWAPLDEIVPMPRKNDWAIEHELDDVHTLLYSGTIGLKHNPALLVGLARQLIDNGTPARLVVVNEGPAVQILRSESERSGVPLTLLPFQPYERLPEVLATGDVLVVLLEPEASAFSVPSKTLSYLCAGRPVLGLMPSENPAAALVSRAGGLVIPPIEGALPDAAAWVADVLCDADLRADLGDAARDLAELEFALPQCASRFEGILAASKNR